MANSNNLEQSVQSLPLQSYYDSKNFEDELKAIWQNEWIYACHEKSLKEPLSFITLKISNYNVVILRDKNSELVAYLNTCRHRGSILCEEDSGKLKKNLLVCQYHQWSYNVSDGKLVKTSSFEIPANFNPDDHTLHKVQMQIWNGLIFINFNNKAKWDIDSMFQDYDDTVNKVGLENFEIGHTWQKTIKCNWKIFWENYSECLHCPNIHPELSDLVPVYSRRIMDIKDSPDWEELSKTPDPKFQGGLKEGAETWSSDGSAQGHKLKALSEVKDFPGHIYLTNWPSMFMAIFIDHIRIVRVTPIDKENMSLSVDWFFESATLADPKYDKKNVVDFATLVMGQDGDACELNQKGVYNPAAKTGTLMPEEYELKRFHDWLRQKVNYA
ncbi:MAG: aromatic ring-hydroxylating dioxygenase subunit alpha [Pelagibacterales bacterium]|nr:aromatic ring-hydroxylating dioxygenase subunit alpha [Pelagibacterales bacterium]